MRSPSTATASSTCSNPIEAIRDIGRIAWILASASIFREYAFVGGKGTEHDDYLGFHFSYVSALMLRPAMKAIAGFSVGATGFEPATSCSRSRRATGLRYAPKNEISLLDPKEAHTS
jgi:hypothetical protein